MRLKKNLFILGGLTAALLLTYCAPPYFDTPLEALTIPPGYLATVEEGEAALLARHALPDGEALLYTADSFHAATLGQPCLVLTYVVAERRGWRPHLSYPTCAEQLPQAIAGYKGLGQSTAETTPALYGYHPQAQQALIGWADGSQTTVTLSNGALLLVAPAQAPQTVQFQVDGRWLEPLPLDS